MKGILWAVPLQPLKTGNLHLPKRAEHIHCTLGYGVERFMVERYIGQTITGYVWRKSWNDRAEALEISFDGDVYCENPYPHITLALASDAFPVESNHMLATEENRTSIKRDQFIKMQIEFLEWIEPPTS